MAGCGTDNALLEEQALLVSAVNLRVAHYLWSNHFFFLNERKWKEFC